MTKWINAPIIVVLIGLTLLVLAALPLRTGWPEQRPSRSAPNAVETQATTANTDAVLVAQPASRVVEYTLMTRLGGEPAMAFVGVGGDIDGVANPELVANVGDTVRITVINGDPTLHDLKIDEFGVSTGEMIADEQTVTVEFVADRPGEFSYYCSIPGHRQIGMEGILRVMGTTADGDARAQAESDINASDGSDETGHVMNMMAMHTMNTNTMTVMQAVDQAVSVVRHPTDVPPPMDDRGPQHHQIDLTAVELDGVLADGTTYRYMTFNGQVPGPMLRVRVNDTVELHLHNEAGNSLPHSIDLHAVTGPGGGAVNTQTLPGEETSFTFQALPGLYVYHCATASVPHHITSGMYGLILVEPVGGLPPVDHEFYVMQGEIYTEQPFGTQGHLDFSYAQMLDEHPEYFVLNGAAGALTNDEYALRANVGETVRIYFGVGGPNFTSSFHIVGEIFDRVYDQASLTAPPLTDVQTTLVAPGGATMVEFTLDVQGRYILVDHALSRMERGLAGYLYAEGEENPAVYHSESIASMAGH